MYHTTPTGSVEIVAQWGHGKLMPARLLAVLTSDDGDGHFTAWAYVGEKTDAIRKIAELELRDLDPGKVAHVEADHVSIAGAPANFGRPVLDGDGEIVEVIFDAAEIAAAHPGVVAWS